MMPFCRFIACIPLCIIQSIGWGLGWLYWLCSRQHRSRLSTHLRQAGLVRGWSQAQLARAKRKSISEQGISLLEFWPHWLRPIPALLKLVTERRGWEHLETALTQNKPIIFISPHLGAIEMTGVCITGWIPHRTLVPLYRPPKQSFLAPLMIASRTRGGAQPAPANLTGVRILIKALRHTGIAYLLPDQVPSAGEGVWAPFFGKRAYTMTLLSKLAIMTDAIVLPCFTERLGIGRGYRFHIQPFKGQFNGNLVEDARTLNVNLENLIQQFPEQYLWGYNRYKCPAGVMHWKDT